MEKRGRGKQGKKRAAASSRPASPPTVERIAEPRVTAVSVRGEGPRGWLLGLPLLIVTLLAYLRVFGADFLRWDDQHYVLDNPLLADMDGLRAIWDPMARAAPQYYPLTFTSFWLERWLWGLDPRVYHATNLFLHLVGVLLLVAVLRALRFSPAAVLVGAGMFALHPVQVASVAWVAERKNVLAGSFLLLSLWALLGFARKGGVTALLGSWASFVLALLSKTQVVAWPIALLLLPRCLGAGRGQPARPSTGIDGLAWAACMLPYIAVGVLLGWLTVVYEEKAWTPQFSILERFLIASNALVFYVRTVLLPIGLSPVYPRWSIEPESLQWWVSPMVLGLVAIVAVWQRKRWDERGLWGVALFVSMLLPVLGLRSFNFFTYSFVADHFLYFSMIGAGIFAAAVWDAFWWRAAIAPGFRLLTAGAAGALLLVLAVRTHFETAHWLDNERFWLRVQQRNPGGFLALYNLGNHFRELGQWARAAEFFEKASEARPGADYAFRRYAEALRHARGPAAVLAACDRKLAAQPAFSAAFLERAVALEALGRSAEAAENYRKAMTLAPPGSAVAEEARQGWRRLTEPS